MECLLSITTNDNYVTCTYGKLKILRTHAHTHTCIYYLYCACSRLFKVI